MSGELPKAANTMRNRFPWESDKGIRRRLIVVWMVAGLLVVVVGAMSILSFRQEWRRVASHLLDNEHHHIQLLGQSGMARKLFEKMLITMVLRNEILDAGEKDQPRLFSFLASAFSARIDSDKGVESLSLLDSTGREEIRVDRVDAKAVPVRESQLRELGQTPAFMQLQQMRSGEVYVGRIITDSRGPAVIRVGFPILDPSGHFQGVLLNEYRADDVLNGFTDVAMAMGKSGLHLLLDYEGNRLAGSSEKWKAFGLARQQAGVSFSRQHPQVWKEMLARQEGYLERSDGIYLFKWKNPLALIERNMTVKTDANAYRWAIVSFLPREGIDRQWDRLVVEYAGKGGVGLVLLLLLSTLISVVMYQRKSARGFEASSEFMEHLLTGTPLVYHVCVRRGGNLEPVYFGPGFRELTGYDADEFLQPGMPSGMDQLFAHIHPDDLAAKKNRLRNMVADEVMQFEFRFQHADGHWMWIGSSYKSVFDDAGEVIELIAGWQDISKRKRIESELQASEERFRTYAQFSPVGIFEHDPEGNCIYVNPRCCKIVGRSQQEIMGKGWSDGLHPDDADRVVNDWLTWVAGKADAFHDEHRFIRSDGNIVWISVVSSRLVDAEGQTTGYLGSVVDVTPMRNLLSEVQRLSQRLIQLREEEHRELARALHDDIGQVLTGIHFYAESIHSHCRNGRLDMSQQLSGDLVKMVDELMQTVHVQLGLVRAGNLEELGLSTALQELAEYWQQPGMPQIELSLEDVDTLDWDAMLALYRVAQGALANVVRHAAAKHVKVKLEFRAGVVVLSVVDDGRGFDPGSANQGYGLLGMREHLAAVGGSIQIESALGQGTRIEACVPSRGELLDRKNT